MKHIFLSYSRTDSEMLRRVSDTLKGEGLAVWTDESLTPGTPDWQDAIEKAIEGAGAVVVLLSPDAKKSQWVANELGYAGAYQVPVFPILVRGEDRESVPIQLINTQRVDIRSSFLSGMQQLVNALTEYLRQLKEEDASSVRPKADWTIRPAVRTQFWKGLQERSKGKTELFTALTALDSHFLSVSAGRKGFSLGYTISMEWASVDLYIDAGSKEANKAFFDRLFAQKATVEAELGIALEWMRLDNKRASKITVRFEEGGLDERESWPAMQDRMIDTMIQFDRVFRPRIIDLKA